MFSFLFFFFPMFLSKHLIKACQWTLCHACKSMENALTNRSHAAATWQRPSDWLVLMIGRTCRLTPSPIQSTTSAWVWLTLIDFLPRFMGIILQKSLSFHTNLMMMSRRRSFKLWTRKLFRSILKSWRILPEKTMDICPVEKYVILELSNYLEKFRKFSKQWLLARNFKKCTKCFKQFCELLENIKNSTTIFFKIGKKLAWFCRYFSNFRRDFAKIFYHLPKLEAHAKIWSSC